MDRAAVGGVDDKLVVDKEVKSDDGLGDVTYHEGL